MLKQSHFPELLEVIFSRFISIALLLRGGGYYYDLNIKGKVGKVYKREQPAVVVVVVAAAAAAAVVVVVFMQSQCQEKTGCTI